MSRNMILVISTTVFRRSGPPPKRSLGFGSILLLPLSIGIVATILSCGTSSATDASDAAPSDTGSGSGADATVDDGVGDSDGSAEVVYCGGAGSISDSWVDERSCPSGSHCVHNLGPYCGASWELHGICQKIPVACPEADATDAMLALCTGDQDISHAPMPESGIYPSECQARKSGYRGMLSPVDTTIP